MSTFTVECSTCERKFKTLYSLNNHRRDRHEAPIDDFVVAPVFKDDKGIQVSLPKPVEISKDDHADYLMWLAGLVERINSTFHPRLPGRWVKIDMHQVPVQFFLHFLAKLQVQANSIRDMPHKGLPVYKSNTRKVSYKFFQLEKLQNALDEQGLIQLNANILYAGQTQIIEEANHPNNRTAAEEIARAKQRAYQPRQGKRPSSKSVLVVGRGEGRSTREVEVIWWPDLYTLTNHGQMTLRLFIEKCDF